MKTIPPSFQRRRGRLGGTVDVVPQGFWATLVDRASRSGVLVRLALCLAATLVLLIMLHGWTEPLPFREGMIVPHGVVARVPFEKPDPERTRAAQERAAAQVRVVYSQDRAPIVRLRDGLKNRVAEIAAAESLATVSRAAWLEFAPEAADVLSQLPAPAPADKTAPREPPVAPEPPEPPAAGQEPAAAEAGGAGASDGPKRPVLEAEQAFQKFRSRLDTKEKQLEFDKAVDRAFADVENLGVLEKIQHGIDEGSQTEIDVHPVGNASEMTRVQVADVLLGEAKARLKSRIEEELGENPFAERVFAWIDPKLAGSLEIDREATARAKQETVARTPQQFVRYAAGDLLAEAGTPITADELVLLRREHVEYVRQQDARQRAARAASMLGLFVAMFALSGFYIHLHHREVLDDLGHVATLIGMSAATVVLCMLSAGEAWRAEILPLLVFAMTVAIAYDEDVALLMAAEVALVVVIGLGRGLSDYVTLVAAAAAMIFWMGRLRSRSKLIYVGLWAGAVALATQVGANLLEERPFGWHLLYEAGRTGVWTLLAGFLMTGLLPFIERTFGVLTDLSLLEVGDVAHPLLQELVRRAPGTYNHSINVASIGEAAAEAIGARGLLVRVGAYFHDIGKMLKPAYFVENQGQQASRHESLVPAMSTLIIIAHVKEGAELARQYNLPQPIIDLITEHHGTTLVEYFYRRATERSQSDPNGGDVDEQTYRYPGPKPSTRESAVMMLADAVESASRALTEPTPARIASLVHDLAMKRLLDGQFDQCGLTLEELEVIEQSLVKSLTAVYHGRVKYPDQRTA
ncbi:MAG: HDIG domain-containing protein [Planctomycetia bacterium]|nr:HDIG domain-containing protein [Planctomycetia bacterium]